MGLMVWPRVVRNMDRLRESRKGVSELPSILDGQEKKGIRSLDGTALFVDYLGEKDPTVFLAHGYTGNGTEFHYQKPYLAEKYRVVSMDFRGHGRSEVPESKDYHVERLAEDLKAVVDAFEPERFVVAGHSMGGITAFKFYELFANEYKDRLKGLAIIDSTGLDLAEGVSLRWRLFIQWNKNLLENDFSEALAARLSDSPLMYLCMRWLVYGKRPPASEIEFLQRMGCSTPIITLRGAARNLLEYHLEHCLPNVDVPVMLLVGSEDTLMANDRENNRTFSLLPDARLKVFKGAGHCAPQEQPDEFNQALGGFLAEVFA
ncbi:MAG: alpha/beta hydrolase [Actinobacteria bacterium]|nr:alpha/beta hydrolase [Actinomycetota bacterium]